MECTCMIDGGYDAEPVELYLKTLVKARKDHKCNECGRLIEAKETYYIEKFKFDGVFDSYKTCIDCLSLRSVFMCSWTWGDIVESIENYINDCSGKVPESCFQGLTQAAVLRVAGMIDNCWAREDEITKQARQNQ